MSTTHRGRNTLITALAVIVMAAALGGLAAPGQHVAAAGPPSRVVVRPGESIQEAVDQAVTGSTILVRPGTYREQVRITTDGITLRGNHARIVPPVVTVDGTCQEPGATAICVIGDVDETGTVLDPVRDVSVTGFTVSGFTGTGLYAYGGDGITVSRNRFVDNGGYGTFARRSTGITITDNLASRNVSAGIYVGINPDAKLLIAGNRSTENREGLLLLDTVGGTIVDNDFSDNCVGALLASSGAPGVAPSADLDVIGNRVNDSNRACGPIGEVIPPLSGAGIVLAGTSDVLVFDNTVRRSVSTGPTAVRSGISVVAAFGGSAGTGNRIIGNRMADNVPVDLEVAAGGDVAVAANRCGTADIDGACKATVIPPALPGATEPTPADAAPTTSVSSSPATSEEATP
ncbi:MAG TPA: right-handed parallel beta-helix repeat-containing protein [Ilumatobacteraceae bacterium]|nr:right-handed parallel beta-helix repeat-containing protein [Ilumatobacteraceae bacterium]